MSDAIATDNQYTSRFAASFLDVLRKATVDAGMSWTEAELISARDYTLSHSFHCKSGTEMDSVVKSVTSGNQEELQKLLHFFVDPAIRRLSHNAEQEKRRQQRKAAKEAAGRKWNPDEDGTDEWIERIEQSRQRIAAFAKEARRKGRPVKTREGMDGNTFRTSFKYVDAERDAVILHVREPDGTVKNRLTPRWQLDDE